MKKVVFTITGIMLSLFVFSQNPIKFYINNGTKEVTKIKCGNFDDIKVKTKTPSNVQNFDLIQFKVYLSSIRTPASYNYKGKGAISTLKSKKTIEKWLLKPNQKNGDFVYPDTHLGINDLCKAPRKWRLPKIEVTIKLIGYNITGYETYWSTQSQAYKTRATYSDGTVLAKGTLTIKQKPPKTEFISYNGVIKVKIPAKNINNVQIKGAKESNYYKYWAYDVFEVNKITNNEGEQVYIKFIMFDDDYVAEAVKKMFGKIPDDLNPYEELKRDLLQQIAVNSFSDTYKYPFFDWPRFVESWTPKMKKLDDQEKFKGRKIGKFFNKIGLGESRNDKLFFTNTSLWKKEKIGNYEYDVLRIPDIYKGEAHSHYDTNKEKWRKKYADDQPAEFKVYAIRSGKHNIFIFPLYHKVGRTEAIKENLYLPSKKYEQSQKEFVQKTLETIEYLK